MVNTKDKDAAGKTFSYAIAKSVLTDTEKNRCLCLFLNMDHSSINWAKATAAFECKSVESMRVMTRATLKKITDAEKNGGTLPKGGAGGKRKAADEGSASPVKKGKGAGGNKKKKADTPVEDEEEDGKEAVKDEFGANDDLF